MLHNLDHRCDSDYYFYYYYCFVCHFVSDDHIVA